MSAGSWTSVAVTHPGAVRDINEDAFLCRDADGCWLVADGMGGYRGGDLASAAVTQAVENTSLEMPLADAIDAIDDALKEVNTTLIAAQTGEEKMGSTVACLFIRGTVGIALWNGDSRIYRLRDTRFEALSRDHSYVRGLVDRGLLDERDARHHPQRNIVTRAIGADARLALELRVFEVSTHDRYLICSDGLYDTLSTKELGLLTASDAPQEGVSKMLKLSLGRKAQDNITAVHVHNAHTQC